MMGRLIVTADVHGSYTTWQAIRSMVKPTDTLVVAGDLFDTRYGRFSPDFQPGTIKEEIEGLGDRFRYVYGNCDVPNFCPGFHDVLTFTHGRIHILLIHGHAPIADLTGRTTLMIQGHTHVPKLERTEGCIHLNPGSVAFPRGGAPTYGIVEAHRATLMDFTTNTPLAWIDL